MPRERKYRVKLSDEQVKRLKKVMRDKATTLTVRNRCQILLDMDEAHGKQYLEEQCAKRCAVHIATVGTVRKCCAFPNKLIANVLEILYL